jgi:subtilisin-like proprotein convertase family protein
MLLAAVLFSVDLQLELVRESLVGTHYRYRQYVDGVPVAGGEVNVTVRPDGKREEWRDVAKGSAEKAAAYVNVDGVLRPARRLASGDYVDSGTGDVIRRHLPFAYAKPARVFLANPVETLNDRALQDQNDSASAVPAAAYATVDLQRAGESGPLGGQHVQIVDTQAPSVAPADASQPLLFDRSESGFEDANAYFHIDKMQEHLRSLGFTGGRAVAPYAVDVDTHAGSGGDVSFYASGSIAGRGMLFFGEGGTDDAEDPDLVVHEYGHVLHDWIAPLTYLGAFNSQARAISEGFGDYLAFSAAYELSVRSGRDPFCIADWDARCWMDASSERCAYPAGSDCLRRVDSAKRLADYLTADVSGTEHRNGEIWSSALREMFQAIIERRGLAEGRRTLDTIVIESMFGPPPNPGFATIARNMLAADRYLYFGANGDVICAAMIARGILSDCAPMPRGELTWVQSSARGVRIPDNDFAGVTLSTTVTDPRLIERISVAVDIAHSARGDLRISLIAPDGTELVLQNLSLDQAHDIHAVFGRDAVPVNSLDVLRGRPAAGEWRLRITDLRVRDEGTVLSWSLVIQFAGDAPLESRPTDPKRQTIPVVGRTPGGNGTFFVSDVRVLNRASRATTATLIYTPAGVDGRLSFGAVNVSIGPSEVFALNDVVGRTFATTGIGQLEVVGDVLVTTRTYNVTESGSFGLGVPPVAAVTGVAQPALYLSRLESSDEVRTNVGFTEVSGQAGRIRLTVSRSVVTEYDILPFGQLQTPITLAGESVGLVEVIGGDAQVAAYAAIIDNRSGDSIFLPGEPVATRPASVAPAISASGAFGTQWRTDLWFLGRVSHVALPLSYTDVGGRVTTKTIMSSTNATVVTFRDAVQSLFERLSSLGTVAMPESMFLAGSRTWTDSGRGSYGQFIPFAEPSDTPARDAFIENSDHFRTNLGLIADVPSIVRVTILDAAGREVSRSDRVLQPYILDHFAVTDRVTNGRVRIELLEGRVYAYSSIVDNRSGDPTFLLAH